MRGDQPGADQIGSRQPNPLTTSSAGRRPRVTSTPRPSPRRSLRGGRRHRARGLNLLRARRDDRPVLPNRQRTTRCIAAVELARRRVVRSRRRHAAGQWRRQRDSGSRAGVGSLALRRLPGLRCDAERGRPAETCRPVVPGRELAYRGDRPEAGAWRTWPKQSCPSMTCRVSALPRKSTSCRLAAPVDSTRKLCGVASARSGSSFISPAYDGLPRAYPSRQAERAGRAPPEPRLCREALPRSEVTWSVRSASLTRFGRGRQPVA